MCRLTSWSLLRVCCRDRTKRHVLLLVLQHCGNVKCVYGNLVLSVVNDSFSKWKHVTVAAFVPRFLSLMVIFFIYALTRPLFQAVPLAMAREKARATGSTTRCRLKQSKAKQSNRYCMSVPRFLCQALA